MTATINRNLASDNTAGVCPEGWAAMEAANAGPTLAYGVDHFTDKACNFIRDLFETDCEVFFTFNGTAANSLALGSLCQSFHAVITHEAAHVETDECGAPEFFTGGTKLLLVGGEHGRIDPGELERMAHKRRDIHFPKPRALSITQATELGTLYRVEALRELGAMAHGLGLKVHMDGARFANAVAALGCAPKELTWRAGVDVLCFGGTKNGLAVGDAVVFFNKEAAAEFDYRCKQAGQLASKMRYLSAPWMGMLADGAWLKHAAHANACADRLARGIEVLPGVSLAYPREANAVFLLAPRATHEQMRARGWVYYDFPPGTGAVRLMCSWATTFADIDAFLADLRAVLGV